MIQTDFLVIGSGIAGLSFALKAAQHGKVLVITKSNEDESNTKYAQGGIAVVTEAPDSFEKHIQDTLIAGDGLCNREVVRTVVEEGPQRIKEIIEYGTDFDKDTTGHYDLAREGGHSESRVLHHKDVTGLEIETVLLERIHNTPNITLLNHYFALELITQHHLGKYVDRHTEDVACYGIYGLDTRTGKVERVLSKVTVMASGGAGHVYRVTTNPTIATGDGIAMAYRAKAKVKNMEFIQFHPTALYNPGEFPSFLVSEAVRGAGGILRNNTGEDFMLRYDLRGSLAPRDIVARAIDNEMKRTGEDHVLLDCRHIAKEEILEHFPNIYNKCMSVGIDMCRTMVPVAPAAHYICGGIMVDEHGRSSVKNLYACGECSSTGLHGANRLASNSLLEALVYAHRIYDDARKTIEHVVYRDDIPEWDEHGTVQTEEEVLVTHNRRELQTIMTDYVGIVRSDYRLERAAKRLHLLYEETEAFYKKAKLSVPLCELRNLIQVAYVVMKSARLRKESRGLHYNSDYPAKVETDIKDTVF